MSFIPGDEYHLDPPFDWEGDGPILCVICKDAPATDDDYCAPCAALVAELDADVAMNCQEFEAALQVAVAARRAFPILRPITVKPVELNAQLWAEVRRETDMTGTNPTINATLTHQDDQKHAYLVDGKYLVYIFLSTKGRPQGFEVTTAGTTNISGYYRTGGLTVTGEAELVDYDGVFELPSCVLAALKAMEVDTSYAEGLS